MKGGKNGRKRRGAAGSPSGRGGAKRGTKTDGRTKGVAPPKGSAKKPHFGGSSSSQQD
jgi:hypothetical protein